MNNLKKTILCAIIFLVGLAIMLYPSISNYFKQKNHVGVIQDYLEKTENRYTSETSEKADALMREKLDECISAAREYAKKGSKK